MKEPISIREIFAAIIKRGRLILCVAVALAIVMGAMQLRTQIQNSGLSENSAENIEKRYQEAMEKYNGTKEALEKSMEDTQMFVERQQDYIKQSKLMQLDPYNMYRSQIVIAISASNGEDFKDVFEQERTPIDYILTRIQDQYTLVWNNMTFSDTLEGIPTDQLDDKYLREMLSLQKGDGGTLIITAYASTAEEASVYANAIYESVMKLKPTIDQATYAHNLSVIANSTKASINSKLADTQQNNIKLILNSNEELEKYEQELAQLTVPQRESVYTTGSIVKSVVVRAVIGGIIGVLLSCVAVWIAYILQDSFSCSRQAEDILGAPFLGSAEGKVSVWARWAYRFMGDRQWKDQERALTYISENIKESLDGKQNIVLVSTLKIAQEDARIQALLKVMKDLGHTVSFVNQVEENPAAASAMRNSDYAVFAERSDVSSRVSMKATVELAKRYEVKSLGFVLV